MTDVSNQCVYFCENHQRSCVYVPPVAVSAHLEVCIVCLSVAIGPLPVFETLLVYVLVQGVGRGRFGEG